jgi:hypothetical protein
MFGMPPAANGSAPGLGGGGGGGGVAYTSSGVPPYHNLGGAPNMGLPSPTAAAALYATGSTFGALPVALDAYGQPTGSADPYAAAAFAQGAAYAAANAPGGYVGIPTGLVAAPGSDSDIRTVFISGFPLDVRERELHNMLRMMPGFEACQMNWKAGAPQVRRGWWRWRGWRGGGAGRWLGQAIGRLAKQPCYDTVQGVCT